MSGAQPQSVLVVDDEAQLRRALTSILAARGYEVGDAGSVAEAYDVLAQRTPDLLVLDLTLPDVDGIEFTRQVRSWLQVPILVLSVRSGDADKIAALDAGADDYLTKPFSAGELLARVRALLRRGSVAAPAPALLRADDLEIDFGRRNVRRDGEEIALTRTEFEILAMLASNAGRVITARQILSTVWGEEYAEDRQTLRVHVHNLRKKIEAHPAVPRHILTEPGVGFRFEVE